jgi:glucose uptake protein GlcU
MTMCNGFVLLPSSIVIGGLGVVLVFIGVLMDRIKEKQEEDEDDLTESPSLK